MSKERENVNPAQPRIVEKLDYQKTDLLRTQFTLELTKWVVTKPRNAESASAVLASLIFCAYQLASKMWGPSEAMRAIRAAVELEASRENKGNN